MNQIIQSAGSRFAGVMLTVCALLTGAGYAIAAGTSVNLSGSQEVPPVQTSASGTGTITVNDDKSVSGSVTTKGIKATMAHIHGTAPKGTNAGVKHDLTNVLKKETSGSFTDSVKIDASDIKEDSLLSGFYYFNIHTAANPGGEIRAQIELQ